MRLGLQICSWGGDNDDTVDDGDVGCFGGGDGISGGDCSDDFCWKMKMSDLQHCAVWWYLMRRDGLQDISSGMVICFWMAHERYWWWWWQWLWPSKGWPCQEQKIRFYQWEKIWKPDNIYNRYLPWTVLRTVQKHVKYWMKKTKIVTLVIMIVGMVIMMMVMVMVIIMMVMVTLTGIALLNEDRWEGESRSVYLSCGNPRKGQIQTLVLKCWWW